MDVNNSVVWRGVTWLSSYRDKTLMESETCAAQTKEPTAEPMEVDGEDKEDMTKEKSGERVKENERGATKTDASASVKLTPEEIQQSLCDAFEGYTAVNAPVKEKKIPFISISIRSANKDATGSSSPPARRPQRSLDKTAQEAIWFIGTSTTVGNRHHLSSNLVSEDNTWEDEENTCANGTLLFDADEDVKAIDSMFYEDNDDFLDFYSETHEEQLPTYSAFLKVRQEERLRHELAAFDQRDILGRKDIEYILNEQMKEKKASLALSLEKYVEKQRADEKRDRQRLHQLYQERTATNRRKISQTMRILQSRHKTELQTAMQQHQQQAQQRQVPEQMASAEWQSLSRNVQMKHQSQLQEFKSKGEEMKNKTNSEYEKEKKKIQQLYEQKIKNADKGRMAQQLYTHFQQMRQRYMKRHLHRVVKERDELLKTVSVLPRDTPPVESQEPNKESSGSPQKLGSAGRKVKGSKDVASSNSHGLNTEKEELNPTVPYMTRPEWVDPSAFPSSGAATRHKHRKGVMNQAKRHLTVEVHNEGIWYAVETNAKSVEEEKRGGNEGNNSRTQSHHIAPEDLEFIPWGIRAFSFLESVVCGEIPALFDRSKELVEVSASQGGQVRCIVSDLRTSEESASACRAAAVREFEEKELAGLEKKYRDLMNTVGEAEKACAAAQKDEQECMKALQTTEKEVAKATRCQDDFRNKLRNYLGPGTFCHAASF